MVQAAAAEVVVDPVADFDKAFDEAADEAEKTIVAGGDEPAPKKDETPPKTEEPKKDEPKKDGEQEPKTDEPVPVVKDTAEIVADALAKAQEAAEARATAKATKDAEAAAAAQATKDAEAAAAALAAPYVLAPEEQAALDKMKETFPGEYLAMEARLKQEGKAMTAALAQSVKAGLEKIDALEKKLTPVVATVAKNEEDSARAAHFEAIRKVHADYDTVVAALPAWIEKIEDTARKLGAQLIYERGDAAAITKLVTDYKKEAGITAEEPPKDAPKKDDPKPASKKPSAEEIASGTPVGSRRAAPSTRGAADKNDYDGAWEEATANEK